MKNGGRVTSRNQKIIPIDRTSPTYDSVWKIEEEDERSSVLTKIDLMEVRPRFSLKRRESVISGEEKLSRLKAKGFIRLDAQIFLTLWNRQDLIPEAWKQLTGGKTTKLSFDGTVFSGKDGQRFVICLYWENGKWEYCPRLLSHSHRVNDKSLVLL